MNSLLIYFLLYSIQNFSLKETLSHFLPILIITIIPISSWIYYNVKTKKYTDADVSDRKQRKGLYFFISGAIISYLNFVYLRYERIDFVLLFLLILLVIMQISNYFIKSSMHTALNIFVAALMFTLNPIYGLIWLGFTIAVAYSRIVLRRHSLAEVLSGAVIASIISFIYLYTHIQNQ
ncbi:ABC transporter permease [Kaistella flava (ex Peng et al. 2021)]|nr:ABC transporter permease [Kaistella flava (ex Peng et al. 2021)]